VILEKYLCQCHFLQNESHVHSPGIEPEPLPFLFLFTSCSSCRLETSVYFTGPHVAQAVLVCMRKLLETSILTGICSYIHFLFFSVPFLVYYYFSYFLAFLYVLYVNVCITSILFCNCNTSDPTDVSV